MQEMDDLWNTLKSSSKKSNTTDSVTQTSWHDNKLGPGTFGSEVNSQPWDQAKKLFESACESIPAYSIPAYSFPAYSIPTFQEKEEYATVEELQETLNSAKQLSVGEAIDSYKSTDAYNKSMELPR